jgi:hypothetical protein
MPKMRNDLNAKRLEKLKDWELQAMNEMVNRGSN